MYRNQPRTLVVFLWLAATAVAPGDPSVARQWNEENLAAIRIDTPHPPVHARNLFHVAAGMYDAWAAYDTTAIGYIHHERATAVDVDAARNEAISYAAFRILRSRFINSASATSTRIKLEARMAALGYDKAITTTDGPSPAAVGNRIAASILAWGLDDGSGQAQGYADPDYVNDQPEFKVLDSGVPLGGYPEGSDPDRWHPLSFDQGFTQNGIGPILLQPFVGVTWIHTRPFNLRRTDAAEPWYDSGGPPRLRGGQAEEFRALAVELLWKSQGLGAMDLIDISPASRGNNSLGAEDGGGHSLNPVTGEPYAPHWVPRGDYGRVLAEFWADGPDSETPPGHWHTIANAVSEAITVKRIGGTGPVVSDLEWDVKLYFALAAATHDAACAAWSLKIKYESPRPITMIRFLSLQGQCSDPALPGYHPEGLPLVPGLTDVVTAESLEAGGVHEDSGFAEGDVVVLTWPGSPAIPAVERSLPRWIRGIDWFPYQRKTFVSPAFPGYISGHSAFSRAAAEVLAKFTGSEFFPGGLGGYTAPAGTYLKFEYGPSVDVNLEWATYFDAADEAGASRRWGGIHPWVDDFPGRIIGSQVGLRVWDLAPKYWDASIIDSAMVPAISRPDATRAVLEWNSQPGLWYRIERCEGLNGWQEIAGPIQATEPTSRWTDSAATGPCLFYRIVQEPAP
ncbi:vanadium-dependent haloperoxidase [Luteolibacter marinus]|uniref:vanadium-dependent haloperoxidase n=1 Tax=Luteolibacter marinus TaxID=2776705 RepID=UPI001868C77F|nr:vanadium-dependent haloperoxidase [Luteolibacter marinus]